MDWLIAWLDGWYDGTVTTAGDNVGTLALLALYAGNTVSVYGN